MGWVDVAEAVGVLALAAAASLSAGAGRIRRTFALAGVDPGEAPPERTVNGEDDSGLRQVRAAYFGEPWDVPALDGAAQTPTPVGETCRLCGEPVQPGDRGWIRCGADTVDGQTVTVEVPHHRECEALGVVGHHFGVCDCAGFDTSRASALELWRRIGVHDRQEVHGG